MLFIIHVEHEGAIEWEFTQIFQITKLPASRNTSAYRTSHIPNAKSHLRNRQPSKFAVGPSREGGEGREGQAGQTNGPQALRTTRTRAGHERRADWQQGIGAAAAQGNSLGAVVKALVNRRRGVQPTTNPDPALAVHLGANALGPPHLRNADAAGPLHLPPLAGLKVAVALLAATERQGLPSRPCTWGPPRPRPISFLSCSYRHPSSRDNISAVYKAHGNRDRRGTCGCIAPFPCSTPPSSVPPPGLSGSPRRRIEEAMPHLN